MSLFDLHNHLYGSITSETLYEMGKNNPNPRWHLFTNSYKNLYGVDIRTDNFFEEFKDAIKFKDLYIFNKPAPFVEFQNKFDLIIALSRFDEEEIRHVSKDIVRNHWEAGVGFAEYRIMYAPNATREVYKSKTLAACEGLYLGEKACQNKIQARLVVSLHRSGNYIETYEWLKSFMRENELVKKYLVGIDFCYIEEGFPPSEKKNFFQQVLRDNTQYPDISLAILYHVGESFGDKTLKSAVRWVGESALFGAHRLGHCIALGINPETFADKTVFEKVGERLDQIEFEIRNYERLKTFGITRDYSKLIKEQDVLRLKKMDDTIPFFINKEYIDEVNTFQEFVMHLTREESKAVIESCPTSNLYIGMLPEIKNHPIRRFLEKGLRVTIGSDDPGIFDTTLKREYEIAATIGLTSKTIDRIKELSKSYTSEKLSGRKL